jgi:hypothetical protein
MTYPGAEQRPYLDPEATQRIVAWQGGVEAGTGLLEVVQANAAGIRHQLNGWVDGLTAPAITAANFREARDARWERLAAARNAPVIDGSRRSYIPDVEALQAVEAARTARRLGYATVPRSDGERAVGVAQVGRTYYGVPYVTGAMVEAPPQTYGVASHALEQAPSRLRRRLAIAAGTLASSAAIAYGVYELAQRYY